MIVVRVMWGIIGLVVGSIGWGLVGVNNISDIGTSEFWGVLMVVVCGIMVSQSAAGKW